MLTQEKLNNSFLSIQVIPAEFKLVKWNTRFNFASLTHPFVRTCLPEESKLWTRIFVPLLSWVARFVGLSLFQKDGFLWESVLKVKVNSTRGLIWQLCLPSWTFVPLSVCLNSIEIKMVTAERSKCGSPSSLSSPLRAWRSSGISQLLILTWNSSVLHCLIIRSQLPTLSS